MAINGEIMILLKNKLFILLGGDKDNNCIGNDEKVIYNQKG